MNKIPTAEEFMDRPFGERLDTQELMIEFAKLHVKAALEAASEVHIKVEKKSQHGKYRKWQTVKEGEEVDLFNYDMQQSADVKSILNVYPLNQIK
jgi:hypothetical protein